MKLIITSRRGSTAGGLGRYSGGDIFRCIGRRGRQLNNQIINTDTNSTIAHKLANTVVNGAAPPPKQDVLQQHQQKEPPAVIVNKIPLTSRTQKKQGSKREKSPLTAIYQPSPTKKRNIANKVIDGGDGIILD